MQSELQASDAKKGPVSRVIMLVVSIILGGSGAYFSKTYIETEVEGYRRQYAKTDPMTDVVVPSENLTRGTLVDESVMSLRKIPTQYVDTNSVTADNFSLAIGQKLDFDIDAGTALLWAHLEGGLSPTFSGKVPDGMRALTVRVDEINSVSGFLQPQDRIDLLFTYGDGENAKIRPIIENLLVIATGVQTMVDKANYSGQRAFTTITVQLRPVDAKKISLAQQIGSLTAILRNPEDTESVGMEDVTLAALLGKSPPRRSKKSAVLPTVALEPSIEFIIGGI